MSNNFETRTRGSFDPGALRRSMAEKDPQGVHFKRKYGYESEETDEGYGQERIRSKAEPLTEEVYTTASIPEPVKTEDRDFSRIIKHDQTIEESSNRANEIASSFINEAVLKSHGVSNQEFKFIKPEDKEILVDILPENKGNLDYANDTGKLIFLGWEKRDLASLSEEDKALIVSKNINRKSLNQQHSQMKSLGFSLNEILYVVSEEDRKMILEKKISRDEWIAESRKKYAVEKNTTTGTLLENSHEDESVDPFKKDDISHQIKNFKFYIETLKKDKKAAEKRNDTEEVEKIDEDIKMVEEKISMLKTGKSPDHVSTRPGVFPENTVAESPSVVSQEKYTATEDERVALEKLGYSNNQIDYVLTKEDSASIIEGNLSPDKWLKIKRGGQLEESMDGEKEKTGPLSLFDLGYSRDEILNFSIEQQQEIFKQQLPKNSGTSVVESLPQTSAEEGINAGEEEAEMYIVEEEHAGLDGSYRASTRKMPAKELVDFLKKRTRGEDAGALQSKTIGGLAPSVVESVAPKTPEEIQRLLKEAKAKKQSLDAFEKNKESLEQNGWSFDAYAKLTEEEQQFVFWHNIKAEEFKKENQNVISSESASEQTEAELVREFVDGLQKGDRAATGEVPLTEEEVVTYNKYKAQIDAEITRRNTQSKENYELSARGASEGAKSFLKEQKNLAETEREQKRFTSILEKNYENFDKTRLIAIAKERGLPSGGDKQVVIERLALYDAEKNVENFGFADEKIKGKLSEYNLSEKAILGLSPEFFSLSPEKQMYLFSKLEQKIYRDTDFASKDKNEKELQSMGFWKKMRASFVKGQRQVALREEMIQKIKNGGVSEYGQDIALLNTYLLDAPELRYEPNEKGRLAPYFEYVNTASSNKKFEIPKTFFNIAASRFGEVPFEWSLPSATSRQREMYHQAYSSYVGAKESYIKSVLQEAAANNKEMTPAEKMELEQKARVETLRADAKVRFGSFVTQNPEMEKLSANFVEKVLGAKASDFARGALFTGLGYTTKLLGRATAVTGVGLAVAAGVGGYMAYRKKNLEYTEKELRQRYGKESNDLWLKKPVNASNVYGRLEKLITLFEKTTDDKSRARILETIKTRVFVTEEMMRDGRINFGSQKEQVANQFKLAEMVSKATISVAMSGGFNPEKTKEEETFDRFKEFVKDSEVQKEKNTARAMAAVKGASVGVLGFEAGYGLRYAQEHGYLGAVWEVISEKGSEGFNKAKEIVSNLYSEKSVSPAEVFTSTSAPEKVVPVETVMAGSRGAIGAIDDLQEKLRVKFGTNTPSEYKEFLSKDPNTLAKEWGFYKPGEVNESAVIKKGEGFSIDSKGVVRFDSLNGPGEVYVPKGVQDVSVVESERKFFDGSASGVASNEAPSSSEVTTQSLESYPASRTEIPNEGYVVSKQVKPAPTNWFEKPVPTEFGASPVRGEWKFVTSPDGKITGVNTSKTISEDVLRFRRNPRSFIVDNLSSTTLVAKTDSFALKTLDANRALIEDFITQKNILNSPGTDLTPEQEVFLKQNVSRLNKEITLKTGGAFDGKFDTGTRSSQLGGSSVKETYFSTDNPIKPRVNPSVVSTEDVPSTNTVTKPEEEIQNGKRRPTDPLERIQKIREEKLSQSNIPAESVVNNQSEGGVSVVSLSANEKTYSFNTENIKGKIRFVFDERGAITDIQSSTSTVVKGLERSETLLKDDWMSKVGQHSSDEATGLKKIKEAARNLKERMIILEEGRFKPNSLEYSYLMRQINLLKAEYADVLK